MAHDVREVANFFIRKSLKEDVDMTHLKLQKLVFIAHGWNLALNDLPLIENRIEAWPYGPVIPELFHELKHFGRGQIDMAITFYDPWKEETDTYKGNFTDDEKAVLGEVWRVYGSKSAVFLSDLTHRPGTPWSKVRERERSFISDEMIKQYYKSKVGA